MKRSRPDQPLRAGCCAGLASLLAACSFIPVYERPAAAGGAGLGRCRRDRGHAGGRPRLGRLPDRCAHPRAGRAGAAEQPRPAHRRAQRRAGAGRCYGVQRADRLPSVGVGASGGARRANGNGGMPTPSALRSAPSSSISSAACKSLSDAALARYLASDEGRRAAQVTLIAAVANAELTLRADDEQLQVTRRTLASREEGLRLVRVRFDGGVAAEPELRGAESLVAGARATLAALQRQRSQDAQRAGAAAGPAAAGRPAAGAAADGA